MRDPIDTLRTKYWYEGLRCSLRASTAYELERKIEPEAFKTNADHVPIHRNKWWRYRQGLHTPNAATVQRADRVVPDAHKDLNHALWDALRVNRMTGSIAHELFGKISPELQLILLAPSGHWRISGGDRYMGKFEHRASLDALAVITILFRLHHEYGDHAQAWEFARRIFRMLLLLARDFMNRHIAKDLFQIFSIRIFSLARWGGKCFQGLSQEHYVRYAHLLNKCAEVALGSDGRKLNWSGRIKYMRGLLEGDKGFDWYFLLTPIIGPDLNLGPPPEAASKLVELDIRIKAWCYENIISGGTARFPPSEMLDERIRLKRAS